MSFLGLGSKANNCGIVGKHAYCLTGFSTVTYKGEQVQLVRLRNPWGNAEWEGAWNDKSVEMKELSEEDKKKVGLVIDDDGEFWISVEDALKNYRNIQVCYWFPEKLIPTLTQIFDIQKYHAKFTSSNGGYDEPWKNPQYVIEIKDNGNSANKEYAIIAYAQIKCKQHAKVGFAIQCYKIFDPNEDVVDKVFPKVFFATPKKCKEIDGPGGFQYGSQRVTASFKVSAGKYIIVPSLHKPTDYGFVLTIFVPIDNAHSLATPSLQAMSTTILELYESCNGPM